VVRIASLAYSCDCVDVNRHEDPARGKGRQSHLWLAAQIFDLPESVVMTASTSGRFRSPRVGWAAGVNW
jgi:hypothetical protein